MRSLRLEVSPHWAMLMGMTAPTLKLRWFQFSLRTLLVFITLWPLPLQLDCGMAAKPEDDKGSIGAVREIFGRAGILGLPTDKFWPWDLLTGHLEAKCVAASSQTTNAGT